MKDKKKLIKILLIVVALIIILILSLKGCGNNPKKDEEMITFEDKIFEKMIMKELGKDEIYP